MKNEKEKRTVKWIEKNSVLTTNGCRIWTQQLQARKPLVKMPGLKSPVTAQRAAWIVHFGQVPSGFRVTSSCGNKRCVSKDHIQINEAPEGAFGVKRKEPEKAPEGVEGNEGNEGTGTLVTALVVHKDSQNPNNSERPFRALSTRVKLPVEAIQLLQKLNASIPHDASRRVYNSLCEGFMRWCIEENKSPWFSRDTVTEYREHLKTEGLGYSRINGALSAVKALSKEAFFLNSVSADTLKGIEEVRGLKGQPKRKTWLTQEQYRELLKQTLGLKGQTVLTVMAFTGLRVREVSSLEWDQITVLDGRAVLQDVMVKGGKRLTVGLPEPAQRALVAWKIANSTTLNAEGVAVPPDKKIFDIGPDAMRDIVRKAGIKIGVVLTPHTLRRTFAKISYSLGVSVDSLQDALGHSDSKTTRGYIGGERSYARVPGDVLAESLAAEAAEAAKESEVKK